MSRSGSGGPEVPLRGKSPEQGPTVRTYVIEEVEMGRGTLAERLDQGSRAGRYLGGVNPNIPNASEFVPKETQLTVTILLLNFTKQGMTIKDVKRWLKAHPEYAKYELARPEHLDALNSHSEQAWMSPEESRLIVAPGVSTAVGNEHKVAYLDAWDDGRRGLDLDWAGQQWSCESWFALVRKAGA